MFNMKPTDEQLHEIIELGINWHTRRNHKESEVVLLNSMAHELLELRKLAPIWLDAVKEPPKEEGWYLVEDKYGEIMGWYFLPDHNDLEKCNIVRYFGMCIPLPPERSGE
jgi:hypothetical protein